MMKLSDYEFFTFISNHERLDEKIALDLIEILIKIYLNDFIYAEVLIKFLIDKL